MPQNYNLSTEIVKHYPCLSLLLISPKFLPKGGKWKNFNLFCKRKTKDFFGDKRGNCALVWFRSEKKYVKSQLRVVFICKVENVVWLQIELVTQKFHLHSPKKKHCCSNWDSRLILYWKNSKVYEKISFFMFSLILAHAL